MRKKRISKMISLMLTFVLLVTTVPVTTIASEDLPDGLLVEEPAAEPTVEPAAEEPAVEEPAAPIEDDGELIIDDDEQFDEMPVQVDEESDVIDEPVEDEPVAPVGEESLIAEDPDMDQEEDEEVAYPAFFQEVTDAELGLTVTASAPEGVLPEDAVMVVTPVKNSDVQDVVDSTADIDGTVVAAVDITFLSNNEEIQPNGDVSIKLATADLAAVDAPAVVHLDTTAEALPTVDAAQVDAEAVAEVDEGINALSFEADQFSIYAIIDVPIDVAGGTYQKEENGLLVTVNTMDGTFDEPVTLEVSAISADSSAYQTAEAELANIDQEYDGMVAFDIRFENAAGEEVEPNQEVNVTIKITDPAAAGVPAEVVDEVTITHILDEGGAEVVSEPEVQTVVDNDEDTFIAEAFSTFTISWRSGNRKVTIHYVDENGKELTVSNSEFPTSLDYQSSSPAYLIYDIAGYEYSYTYINTDASNNRIAPYLRRGDGRNNRYSSFWYRITTSGAWGSKLENGDNIYVVYKPKTPPTTGGTVTPTGDQTWPDGNDAPQFGKTSTSNGDDTNTVSLTIKAAEKAIENSTKANVIVVFDTSGSMGYSLSGSGESRLKRAKTAVKNMADILMAKKDAKGNQLVKMALVSFGTDVTTDIPLTDNLSNYKTTVDGLSAEGGTNWEKALNVANHIAVDSDAATCIVFVTDGNPTFRKSRGNYSDSDVDVGLQYYRDNLVYGTGMNADYEYATTNANFDFAVDQVKEITSSNKTFYAIGVSSDVTKVQNLTTEGGGKAENAFLATDSAALTKAFDSIVSSIKAALGFGDVQITDGVTSLSNTEMKVMETVDPESFTYYKTDSTGRHEWTTRAADGCAAATYDKTKGVVQWNMGRTFQLEDGVTYEVTFRVWPSQEAYDLVTDLNNGVKTEADLTADQKAQLVKNSDGTYSLKTNTEEVKATYQQTTKSGDTVSISSKEPINADYTPGTLDNMPVRSMQLSVIKKWTDELTGGEDQAEAVTLKLQRRVAGTETFADYNVPGTSSPDIVLSAANNWTAQFYVAPGLIDKNNKTLEKGYDYTITEPNLDYHYDLNEEIINPMVINAVPTFVGDGKIDQDGDGDIEGSVVSKFKDQALTAENIVKGGIYIEKKLVDAAGNELLSDDEFTFKGKILDPSGQPYTWAEGDDVNSSGAYHKYDKNGERTTYKGHFASTGDITFTLKPGESIMFINVPQNATYEFYEVTTGMPAGISYQSITGKNLERKTADADYTDYEKQPTVSSGKVSGTEYGNVRTEITVTNKTTNGETFYVYHSSDNTIEKISTNDARVTKGAYNATKKTYEYTFNIYEETKKGTLYGGYYKAYGGQKLTDEEITALTYNQSGSSRGQYATAKTDGKWAKDGTGAVPYTGSSATAWRKANAYTVNGKAMKPVANGVYYLKEVPNGYLRPYVQVIYDKYHKNAAGENDNPLLQLYLITATDDANYQGVGVINGTTKYSATKLVSAVTIKNSDGTVAAKLTAKGTFNNKEYQDGRVAVPRGYIAMSQQDSLIGDGSTFTMKPYFITLDAIEVYGFTTRKITMKEARLVLGDDGNGIEPGITITNEATK